MANYLERVLYLYPNINRVVYWSTQYDGTPWENPYDGLFWENTDIKKPSQKTLDKLDAKLVDAATAARAEKARKAWRDEEGRKNLALIAGFREYIKVNPDVTFSEYLDYLETISI